MIELLQAAAPIIAVIVSVGCGFVVWLFREHLQALAKANANLLSRIVALEEKNEKRVSALEGHVQEFRLKVSEDYATKADIRDISTKLDGVQTMAQEAASNSTLILELMKQGR